MFLELVFNDASSVRDYLERRSIKDNMTNNVIWHEMIMSRMVGFNRSPFIWQDYNGNYHLDIQVKEPKDAYDFLPRYKWDNHMDGLIVYWGLCPCSHCVRIYRFDKNWLWSNEVLRKLIQDENRLTTPIMNIHNTMNINLAVYRARNIREYIPVYPQTESKLSLFELEFHNASHLVSYLEAHEKDEQINIAHYLDYEQGHKKDEYPLIIRQESPYDEQVSYYIDVWAKSEKYLRTFRYNVDIHEIENQGCYDGKPSCKYYTKVWYSNKHKYFPMHEGRYRFRTYKPEWLTDYEKTQQFLKQAEKELNDKYIKNDIVKGSDVNEALGLDSHTGKFDDDLVVTKAFKPDLECNKTYMITARANGKGIGQALKQNIIKQYIPEETGIVAINKKYQFRDMYPTKPRHDDLYEKTLKYIDTDVTACVDFYNTRNKELKERMNIMFGVDLNRIPEIKDVKFNNPATIVFWADGTKTVVKKQKGDRFDKEKGLAMAIVKKLYGNKGKYNNLFKKWIKEDK